MPNHVHILIAVAVSVLFGYGAGVLSWIALNWYRRMSKPEMKTLGEALLDEHMTEIGPNRFQDHWRVSFIMANKPKWYADAGCDKCRRIRTLLKEAQSEATT